LSGAELERLIAELAENDDERRLMSQAVELLAYSPPPNEPPLSLRYRVMDAVSVAGQQGQFHADGFDFARSALLPWLPIAPGVEIKFLYDNPATGARTVLVKIAPNTPFPPHEHRGIEDLYQIEGETFVGDIRMGAGDYCRAPAHTEHNDVRSGPAGALAIVVTQ
jgi:anti-sigma factor ChrR (cupin superfamily)